MTDTQQLRLFDPRRDRARQLRRDGASLRQIREELGLTSHRAFKWVKDIPPKNPRRRVRAKDEVRARARELRAQGKTYTEIAAELGVSKSTCSHWCNDQPRPKPRPGQRRAPDWAPFRARRERERERVKSAAARSVGLLTPRELNLLGAALYWAEGCKDKPWRRQEAIKFINSDETMILVFLAWVRLLGIDPVTGCRLHVAVHETADATAAVEYWSLLTGVPKERFGKTTVKRHNPKTNRRNRGERYHGCLTIRLYQSADLYRRVDGWWRGITMGAIRAGLQP